MEDEPPTLKYEDDIFSIEYESFSYGRDDNKGLDVGFCVQYESFSFDPILSNFILDSSKFEFLESENVVPITANLDQTFKHI